MATISRIHHREQVNPAIFQQIAKVSGLAALATLVVQIAAKHGLFALPNLLKPIFFTTALTIKTITFSHFALICGAISLVAWALSAIEASKSRSVIENEVDLRTRLIALVPLNEQDICNQWTIGLSLSELKTYIHLLSIFDSAQLTYSLEANNLQSKYKIMRDVALINREISNQDGPIDYYQFLSTIGEDTLSEEAPAHMQSVIQLYLIKNYITKNGYFPYGEGFRNTITAQAINQLISRFITSMPQEDERNIYFNAQHHKINYLEMCQTMANRLNLIAEERRRPSSIRTTSVIN